MFLGWKQSRNFQFAKGYSVKLPALILQEMIPCMRDATPTEQDTINSKMAASFPWIWSLTSVRCGQPAETEDVAHILLHVHTVLSLISDLTNCQNHRNATLQPPQQVNTQILFI